MTIEYNYTQKFWLLAIRSIKSLIFDLISDDNLNIFVRTNDTISMLPLLEGTHEPQILNFFSFASKAGYSDFFIDIGGNVGLSSCLASKHFSFFHVYEVNPLAFRILEVNMLSNMSSDKFCLNNFGIGESDGETTLLVPKHNWGGAYIDDKGNSYSDEVLAEKDGFTVVAEENYDRNDVCVKKGSKEFTQIFRRELERNGRPIKGVIKIDVEGYERTIIKELAQSIRQGVSLSIVFENWDKRLSYDDLKKDFEGENIRLSKISRQAPFPPGAPKFLKLVMFALMAPFGRARFRYFQKKVSSSDVGVSLLGDLVLEIDDV